MSFMSKIKDFFYDEEEIEEVVPKKEPKRTQSRESKRKINIYDIEKEKNKASKIEDEKKEKLKDVNERDLFKAEKTFNFPIDVDTTEDFEPVKREAKSEKIEPKKEIRTRRSSQNVFPSYKQSSSDYSYGSLRLHQGNKEEKKFKPTPVISPIYGILDQNYKKDDIKEHSKNKELSFDKKEIDFDTIRKKAYASLDEEIEKTINKKKDLFYNLEEQKKEVEEKLEKQKLEEEYVEEPYKKDEVIITYNDIEEESTESKETEEELEVPKITRSKRNKKVAEEIDKEDSQDLFKIIDNMYKDPIDEEEE